MGSRVLIVDLDPTGASPHCGYQPIPERTIYDALRRSSSAEPYLLETSFGASCSQPMSIWPAEMELVGSLPGAAAGHLLDAHPG